LRLRQLFRVALAAIPAVGLVPATADAQDTTAPNVAWTSPAEGSIVAGIVAGPGRCEVTATDNVAVSRVDFLLDGAKFDDARYAPYDCRFDADVLAAGRHTLTATATDTSGNTRTAVRTVNVAGSQPPDPGPGPQPPPPGTSGGAAPAPTSVVWRGDFESGGLTPWTAQQCAPTTSITLTSSNVRQGRYAARFHVGGPGACFGDRSWRAELQSLGSYEPREGQLRYYSWSSRFDADFPPLPKSHCSFAQWKGPTGGPYLAMGCNGDRIQINSPALGGWTTPLRRGAGWHDFVVKVLHSTSASRGFVEAWHRAPGAAGYTKVVNRTARVTLQSGRNYIKQGYYRASTDPAGGDVVQDGMAVSLGHTVDR
jgi:hypothetical protein